MLHDNFMLSNQMNSLSSIFASFQWLKILMMQIIIQMKSQAVSFETCNTICGFSARH